MAYSMYKEWGERGLLNGHGVGEVKRTLRWIRTTGVKHGRPDPRVDAHVGPRTIKGPHRVRGMHAAAEPVRAEDVHEQVGDGERDRGGLLHAREPPERPLAVVLLHPHPALLRQVRQRVHARVLAVVRARPAREPEREGHHRLLRARRRGRRVAAAVVRGGTGRAGLP